MAWCAGCRRGRCAPLARSRSALSRAARPTARATPRTRNRRARCPRTSSVGFPRTGSSRRGGGETIRGAPECMGGQASTGRRCRARLPARAPRRRAAGGGNRRGCRARDARICARPRLSRSPRGCLARRWKHALCCWRPCGSCVRSGGSAACTGRRTPSMRCKAGAVPRRGTCRGGRVRRPTGGRARTRR